MAPLLMISYVMLLSYEAQALHIEVTLFEEFSPVGASSLSFDRGQLSIWHH